ncbi:MAG: hypothetical protein M3120_03665 [Pseudomonadota bacterium]|nr:hypothetical protein [Pseudomonadota bacterium]
MGVKSVAYDISGVAKVRVVTEPGAACSKSRVEIDTMKGFITLLTMLFVLGLGAQALAAR